jgi:transposase
MLGEVHSEQRVFLAAGSTDLRKSIDGLAAIVQAEFQLDPFSPSLLFVFCNRQRDKVKVLQWDHAGFWLHYRRLERGRFQWPDASHTSPVAISQRELRWLLDGLSITQPKAHKKVVARTVI